MTSPKWGWDSYRRFNANNNIMARCGWDSRRRSAFETVTLTGFTCNLSTVNGAAFITNPSVDISSYVNRKISLTDTGNKTAYFYGKAAGTGETSTELIISANDRTFDTNIGNWVVTNYAPSNAVMAWQNGDVGGHDKSMKVTHGNLGTAWYTDLVAANVTAISAGQLLQPSFDFYKPAASSLLNFQEYIYATSEVLLGTVLSFTDDTWVTYSKYYTATGAWGAHPFAVQVNNATNTSIFYFDNWSYKKITTPSATGITGSDAAGSSTQSWASIEAGFNPNSATFTVVITAS